MCFCKICIIHENRKRSRRLFTKAKPEFSKCDPQSTASASLRNLLEMKILGLYSIPTEPETLEVGPNNLCFNKPSKWFWCVPKFKNHYSRFFIGSRSLWDSDENYELSPRKVPIWTNAQFYIYFKDKHRAEGALQP